MRRPLSKFQIVCIVLLWAALCYIVLISVERIDGPIILTLAISAVFSVYSRHKVSKKRINNIFLFHFAV